MKKNGKKKQLRLKTEVITLDKLKPHPDNPRRHPEPGDPEWEALRVSMIAGYFLPIVFNKKNGMIVSGHLRVKVAQALGYKDATCVVVSYSNKIHIARMIAANKQQGANDLQKLKISLKGLNTEDIDMQLTGYASDELDELMAEYKENPKDIKLLTCPSCSFEFKMSDTG